jgi:transcriptional regulator with XRE-family HTH domain
MDISAQNTDSAVLAELGARLRNARLERNLSQAALAEAAGIGRVTLQRIEEGASGASLPSLIRILRALDLSEGLNRLVPEVAPSPLEEVRRRGRRRRAGSPRPRGDEGPPSWRWGDEGDR